jgi:ketosteroid isomerase-like protein
MSRANIEACEAGVVAINEANLAGFLNLFDPTIEFQSYLAGLSGGGGVYRGHDGLTEYFRDIVDAWEHFEVTMDEYREAGDKVLSLGHLQAKGKTSGIEVKAQLAWVFTFREGDGPGRCVDMQVFTEVDKALQAAGLSE